MWRRVSRKWKDVIDHCPQLWSTIIVGKGTQHIKRQWENLKTTPLDIQIFHLDDTPLDDDWIQVLVDNAYRWRSVLLNKYPGEIMRRLGSSPSGLESLIFHFIDIPHDCRLFNLIRPNLRKLVLFGATFPHDFDPDLGLEELLLHTAHELGENGKRRELSVRKFHQFLQANPNLRTLQLHGHLTGSPNDQSLQAVDLPKLEEVTMSNFQALHLFWSEHCVKVHFNVYFVGERPRPIAWATLVHTLRRVGRFKITVSNKYLCVATVTEPYSVQVTLFTGVSNYGLVHSILEDFLNEAEKDTHISARVDLELFAGKPQDSVFDPGLEDLNLLQTPVWDPSSGQNRWRIPNLDTISMLDPGLPYHRLRAFIQARSNGNCIQPASPITGIFTQSSRATREHREEVLNKVMSCTTGGNGDE